MHKRRFSLIAVALCVAWLTVPARSDDKPAAAGGAGGMTAEMQKQMELFTKLATPGPQHEGLKPMAGTFDAEVTSVMAPGAPPDVSKAVMKNEMVLDGRFLRSTCEGSMMGQPFHGVGYTGYDNLKKKYVGVWMDTMGTMMMVSEGSADPSGKVLTFTSTMPDPETGKDMNCRQVVTIASNDKHTMEMFAPGPDGKEYKCMTIVYTRAK
ncbi:MAG TPA: DUF1579 domain-containing protein [Tepidisphaeraceae bacterium]|jgi:hypothetical protein